MHEEQINVSEVGNWPAEQWQPAIVKPFEENLAHGLATLAVMYPGQAPHPHFEGRIRGISGKRIMVRAVNDPQVACPCGAVQCEVESATATAAMPDWGNYGQYRPTICSEMLYVD